MKNYGDLGECYPPNSLIVKYFNSTSAIKVSQKQHYLSVMQEVCSKAVY